MSVMIYSHQLSHALLTPPGSCHGNNIVPPCRPPTQHLYRRSRRDLPAGLQGVGTAAAAASRPSCASPAGRGTSPAPLVARAGATVPRRSAFRSAFEALQLGVCGLARLFTANHYVLSTLRRRTAAGVGLFVLLCCTDDHPLHDYPVGCVSTARPTSTSGSQRWCRLLASRPPRTRRTRRPTSCAGDTSDEDQP